jgi:molybdopterin adenylyltransferase
LTRLRFAILTVSDRSARGERPDASGPALENALVENGSLVVRKAIVPDEKEQIQRLLASWSDTGDIDVLLTTGGTGFAPRDVTPEATLAVAERLAPGLAEAMRLESLKVTPHAMLSRAVAAIRMKTLIVNLPGSPKGALENLSTILPVLPHAVELLRGDQSAEAGHSLNRLS